MADLDIGILAQATVADPFDKSLWSERFGREFRRVGPFGQMAQHAASLVLDPLAVQLDAPVSSLASELAVVVGTGLANVPTIVPLIRGIHHPRAPRCSPMAFARSVANSAAFHLAQAFELSGPNATVSQEELSFEVALQEAWLMLRLGQARYALVVALDVAEGPEDEQRIRMGAIGVPGRCEGGAAAVVLGPGGPVALTEARTGHFDPLEGLEPGTEIVRGWRAQELGVEGPVEQRLSPIASGLACVEGVERALLRGSGARMAHLQQHRDGSWGRFQTEVR